MGPGESHPSRQTMEITRRDKTGQTKIIRLSGRYYPMDIVERKSVRALFGNRFVALKINYFSWNLDED